MIRAIATIAVLISLAACSSSVRGPYEPLSEAARNPLRAQELTLDAVDALDTGELNRAEKLLREALTADLYHGPAHNNLGIVFLIQSELYEAANEFEWARKLMPGHPDPRMNLALTLERAGRFEEALATYESALEVYPNHMPTMQAMTRLQLRHGLSDDRTPEMLKAIALRGRTAAWREWARRHQADR